MNTNSKFYRHIAGYALATALLLLIPLVAMQFANEVVWNSFDFIFAGTILFGTGLTYEMIARRSNKIIYRAAVATACATALLLVWIEGAVGIIGPPGGLTGLMELGVLAVLIIGSAIARLRAKGMVFALIAAALAQAIVGAVALFNGLGYPASPPLEIIVVCGFFILPFVISAILFHQVTQEQLSTNAEEEDDDLHNG